MFKKLFFTAFIISLGLYASDSSAQIFRIRVTDYNGADANPVVKNFIDTEMLKIQNEVNKDLPSAPPQRLMEGMANSSVMAGKGIGSDYASNMSVFLLGAGVGAGADLEEDKDSDSKLSGAGVAPGVIVGLNLGFMDTQRILGMETERLNLYLNFMNYSYEHKLSEEPGEESNVELDMLAMGIHFRYDWIKGSGTKLFGWGGVKFHFGYEYNKTDITFNSKINEDVNETSGGETIDGNISGAPRAIIASNTHSIPLEISADVQLLYVLSLYGGLGADYSWGEAKGSGSLNAAPSNVNCTGVVCGGGAGTDIEVQPEANIDASGKVNPFLFRGFAGVQINLPYVRIFGQVDKAFGSELIGATAGVRLVF